MGFSNWVWISWRYFEETQRKRIAWVFLLWSSSWLFHNPNLFKCVVSTNSEISFMDTERHKTSNLKCNLFRHTPSLIHLDILYSLVRVFIAVMKHHAQKKSEEEYVWNCQRRNLNCHLRNEENGRNSLPQGRTYQLVIQCQMVSPDNIYTSNTTGTKQVAVIYLGIYII